MAIETEMGASLCDRCSTDSMFGAVEGLCHVVEEDGQEIAVYECPECYNTWEVPVE